MPLQRDTFRRVVLGVAGILLTVVTAPLVHAQAGGELRVGARAGPTFGFLSDSSVPFQGSGPDAATNVNPRLDFHVGGYVIVPLTDRLSVQPELLFLQRGGHVSRPTAESFEVERYRLSYLEGAVLARRDIAVSGPLSVHLVGGIAGDLALAGRLRRNRETASIDVQNEVDLLQTNQLRRWDVSGIVGVGVGYPIGASSRAALEIRYNRGFRSVFESPPETDRPFPLTRPSSLRHDVITASLSYTLPASSLF